MDLGNKGKIMMQIRNIHRQWIDKNSGMFIRSWTDNEYKSLDCRDHIFEQYWCYYCSRCTSEPILCASKNEAEHQCYVHRHYTGHECKATQREFELVCIEFREEFDEKLQRWIYKWEKF